MFLESDEASVGRDLNEVCDAPRYSFIHTLRSELEGSDYTFTPLIDRPLERGEVFELGVSGEESLARGDVRNETDGRHRIAEDPDDGIFEEGFEEEFHAIFPSVQRTMCSVMNPPA